jgi:TolB protein
LFVTLILGVTLIGYSLFFLKETLISKPESTWLSYLNPFFGISLNYPPHWQHVDGDAQYGERFAGEDGFFTITAIGDIGLTLDQAVQAEVGHKLQPYGPEPMVQEIWIDGQAARLILPSETQEDNLRWQAAALVTYPRPIPITIGNTQHFYPIFALYADPAHIRTIADSIKFNLDHLPESKNSGLPESDLTCRLFSEIKAEVCWPSNFSILQITEENRRGSFAAYGFQVIGERQIPYLSEIEFFSEGSIESFSRDCGEEFPCFFGDYPDLERYFGLKGAFEFPAPYQDYAMKRFGDRVFFVVNSPCYGDDCVLREYTTFFEDVMVAVWIVMEAETQINLSDQLFNQVIFVKN